MPTVTSKLVTMVRKRCLKCGKVSLAKPRERRCKQRPHGWSTCWCYGTLQRPQKAKRKRVGDDLHARAERYRAKARKEHAAAEGNVKKWYREQDKAKRLIAKWEKRALQAANKISKTDEEIEATRLAREAALDKARQVAAARRRLYKATGLTPKGLKPGSVVEDDDDADMDDDGAMRLETTA